MKLGKRVIDALTCPPGRRDRLVFDDELPGFAVRVTRDGAKVFLLQYRRGGRVRRLRLGLYGQVTPAQARKLAEAARGRVVAGEDPVAAHKATLAAEDQAARERRRRAKADALTLDKLIARWQAEQLAHASASHRAEAPRALRVTLRSRLDTPAQAIEPAMVRRALEPLLKPAEPADAGTSGAADPLGAETREKSRSALPAIRGGTMARRVRAYGTALYNWAIKRELVTGNPFAAVHVEGRELPRERVLTDAELGEVWRAAGALGWPWGPYFRFLLLTLQREAETAGLAWGELSPDLALWELPGARTKNGKPHVVHLAEPAQAILRAVPRFAGSPLVFTTTGRSPVSGFSHAKVRLDAAIVAEHARRAAESGADAPVPLLPWRVHDFRRTGVTVLARLGTRWEVADKLLNHVQGAIRGVAAVYQRHEFFDERKAALAAWAAHVLAVAAVEREPASEDDAGHRRPAP